VEQEVAGIWCAVLGLERVGIHDNFFALGGHSLKAMRVVSRIQDRLGARVPLRSVVERPTIQQLARDIETILWAVDPVSAPAELASGDRDEGTL
jgi:acyl carrier protein